MPHLVASAALGFASVVAFIAIGICIFTFFYTTVKMTPAWLREQPKVVRMGSKIGLVATILCVIVMCASIGSLFV